MSTENISVKKSTAEQTYNKEIILVVSDNLDTMAFLMATLRQDHYTILGADNALNAVTLFDEHDISAVLYDIGSKEISETVVFQQARTQCPYAVRFALIATEKNQEAYKAIEKGDINHFLPHPLEATLLRQTLRHALDHNKLLREKEHLQNLVIAQHKALVANHELMRQDLALGSKIHNTLLIGIKPNDLPEALEIDSGTLPSKNIDGDFFDFFYPAPHTLDIVIGDVMGKGLPSALVGTAVKMQLTRYAQPLLSSKKYDKVNFWQEDLLSPKEILIQLHHELYKQLIPLEIFTNLFYGRLDLEKRALRYVDCGFTKPIHWKNSAKVALRLEGLDPPLGATQEVLYNEKSVSFEKGDLFVFLSDGVSEAKNSHGVLFSHAHIENILREHSQRTPSELIHLIKRALTTFTGRTFFDDDITIIVIKIKEIPKGIRSNKNYAQFNSHLSQLQSVRDFICRLCRGAPGDEATLLNQLQLAINEVFTNVVKHGYSEKSGQKIIIQGYWVDDGICIDISDQGQAFNPANVLEPDLLGEKESGFGWYIIKSIADEITYTPRTSSSGWNHLTIFKRFLIEGAHMELLKEQKGNTWLITPKCESLDAKNTREFKQQVLDTLGQDSLSNVVLDLSQVNYVDSSGLGSLLSILKYLHSRGGDLKLANLNKPVRTIFELVAMHKIFEIYNDTADALSAVDKS